MTRLSFLLICALIGGCASVDRPKPLTGADIVALAKGGRTPEQIIDELKRTDTVLALRASDYVALHDAGVPDDVLNYLQLAQIEEIRWRERSLHYGPGWGYYYGWGPCRYRGRWGC